ncbi:MAG: hypothetical protein PHG05_04705 [Candidatus Nanoarchaeia archaeon]|nr:hypothetical protein [Candidatus Nanoarchaeia archaeon]
MNSEFKEKLVSRVEKTIQKYHMLNKSSIIPVAFSGGKDSATTIFILKELGYNVVPLIIDKGDDPAFDSEKIVQSSNPFHINPEIIHLNNKDYLNQIDPLFAPKIKINLKKLKNLKEGEAQCTPCYNARTWALIERTIHYNADAFVIGQHKHDLITSLMKCYWTEIYYLNITKNTGKAYDGNLMKELINNEKIDLLHLEKMVDEERASTDDPPVEHIYNNIKLVRPLVDLNEKEIIGYIGDFPSQSSNCTYRETEPRPFRLLVQWDLDRRINENPALEGILFELALQGLNEDGTLKFRPRNKREELYPGFKPFIEKS